MFQFRSQFLNIGSIFQIFCSNFFSESFFYSRHFSLFLLLKSISVCKGFFKKCFYHFHSNKIILFILLLGETCKKNIEWTLRKYKTRVKNGKETTSFNVCILLLADVKNI